MCVPPQPANFPFWPICCIHFFYWQIYLALILLNLFDSPYFQSKISFYRITEAQMVSIHPLLPPCFCLRKWTFPPVNLIPFFSESLITLLHPSCLSYSPLLSWKSPLFFIQFLTQDWVNYCCCYFKKKIKHIGKACDRIMNAQLLKWSLLFLLSFKWIILGNKILTCFLYFLYSHPCLDSFSWSSPFQTLKKISSL